MPKKKPSKPKQQSGKGSSTEATKAPEGEASVEELSDEELAGVEGAANRIGTSTYLDTSDGGSEEHGTVTVVANYIDVGTGEKKKK